MESLTGTAKAKLKITLQDRLCPVKSGAECNKNALPDVGCDSDSAACSGRQVEHHRHDGEGIADVKGYARDTMCALHTLQELQALHTLKLLSLALS